MRQDMIVLSAKVVRERVHITVDIMIDQVLLVQDVMKVGLVLAGLLGPNLCNPFSV